MGLDVEQPDVKIDAAAPSELNGGLACCNCRFWDRKFKDQIWDHGFAAECKRYPPVLEVREVAIDTERIESNGHMIDPSRFSWPITWENDWCGEFKAANVELTGAQNARPS